MWPPESSVVMKIVLAWNPVAVMKIKHESMRPPWSFSSFADNAQRAGARSGKSGNENNPARVKMVVWIKIQNVLILIKTATRHVAAAWPSAARHQNWEWRIYQGIPEWSLVNGMRSYLKTLDNNIILCWGCTLCDAFKYQVEGFIVESMSGDILK